MSLHKSVRLQKLPACKSWNDNTTLPLDMLLKIHIHASQTIAIDRLV